MFSPRSRHESAQNRLALERERLERAGVPLLDLTQSNPTCAGFLYEGDVILRAFASPELLAYRPEPFGALAARRAVAEECASAGLRVAEERMLLTASTSEAYSLVFKLLCDAGDEVLVPAPSYPLLEHLLRLESVRAQSYPIEFDGGFFIDFAALRAKVSSRTRAIVVVSPNNPTGNYLTRRDLEALAGIGLPVVSDEVFASYPIAPPKDRVMSALELSDTLVFALSGLSKLAALPQMKIAWTLLGGPARQVDEALARLEVIADTYLSPSTPSLVALPQLLRSGRSTHALVMARVQRNALALKAALAQSPISPMPIEGGWYAVLRLPNTESEESWVLELLRQAGVWVQPGYFYDFADEPYAILSLLCEERVFDAGVERLRAHVERRC